MVKGNPSAMKRARQNIKQKAVNKSLKSEIRTYHNQLMEAINKKDNKSADDYIKRCFSKLDKAVKNNIMHKNNAARSKSRIMKLLNSAFSAKKELNEINA